jgi:hypothetical protein
MQENPLHYPHTNQLGARTMTLIQAIELGYIHRQGRYKGAPWICNGKQYRTSKEALAAANASMLRHSPNQ